MYFVEKMRNYKFLKRFDSWLFLAVLALSLIGILVVKSAVLSAGDKGAKIMTVQIISLMAGIILSIIVSLIDYKDLKNLGILAYILSLGTLVLVLIKGTGDAYGSRSWLNIGPVTIQPSEFAKISFILIAGIFFERILEGKRSKLENIIKLIIYSFLPIGLVIAQHDFGTALVFIFILFVMVFIAGIDIKYIIMIGTGFLTTLPLIWFFVLNDARKDRIRVFLSPESDPLGSGFNVLRSKMAVGSGQIFGKGIFHGVQTQNSAVPVKESDFIFSVIGEELGFIGCILVILLTVFIIVRIINIAKSSKDIYGSFIVIGIVSMFAIHFIENIGMSIGLLPVTGIPLPFISAGGSSMITNYVALGIVLSVSMRTHKAIFSNVI